MELFILTHSAAETNYRPQVFKTLEEAQNALEKTYDSELFVRDENGNVIDEYDFVEANIYGNYAEITWSDDSYDAYEIFKTEVEI